MDTIEPTPMLALHLTRLQELQHDLTRNMNRLVKRLEKNEEEACLVLLPSVENIVDRKKEKERHKKRWKITLHEIISSGIKFDTL